MNGYGSLQMRFCVGEEPECNGPYCGHAEGCPYYQESMKADSSCRCELEKYKKSVTKGEGDAE